MSLVAGVDCSTQATKVIVVDTDDGTVVATGRAPHEVTGRDGARETHPAVWWDALVAALHQTGLAAEVSALSVAGQQHGLVVTDRHGTPLRPAPLWNDTRAAADAADLIDDMGGRSAWADEVGSVPVASFTAAKWAWLRRTEPGVAAAAAAIRLPHDWLTERLTGEGVTDRGDASGTAWWSTRTEAYSRSVLALDRIDLDPDLLPRVAAPLEVVGAVTTAAAAATGLRPGAVVGPGTGDNMGAALGLGLAPGMPVISLGTSGTAYAVSTMRTVDDSGGVAGFADATGRFLPLAATLNCTVATDRVAGWLGLDRDDIADSTQVVFLPYFDGERTPNLPDAAASIRDLRADTTPQQILRAAYEGAAYSLLAAIETLASLGSGLDPAAPLILVGGGARGAAWRDVIGRLSGRELLVPDATELVALGAAVQAAAVLDRADLGGVAAAWGTARGAIVDAVPADGDRLATLAAAVTAVGG